MILSFIAWNFAGTYDDVKYEADIVNEFVVEDQHLYVSKKINDGKLKFEILQYDEPQEVKDGKLSWYEMSNWNIFWWVTFVISIAVVVITTFHFDNDDVGWDFRTIRRRSLRYFTYTIEENEIFYYMAFGRLLGKRDWQVSRDYVIGEFGINSIRDILFCPEYHTKQQKRENNLDKIGIK